MLALDGSSPAELRAALAGAAPFDARPILIAVDGGLRAFRALRRRPDLVAGDLDSVRTLPRGVPVVRYPVMKNFNDLAGALREARRRGADVVVTAGLTGGRIDHEWANLFEVADAARALAAVVAPGPRGLIVVTARGVRARVPERRTVSVFALGGPARVTVRGTRWTLVRKRLVPGSRGLSNVASGVVAIDVHDGVVALVVPRASRN